MMRGAGTRYRYGNHPHEALAHREAQAASIKILVKLRLFNFDENSARICVGFAQKRRNIANDSFSPLC
jgi:hypothetical protein